MVKHAFKVSNTCRYGKTQNPLVKTLNQTESALFTFKLSFHCPKDISPIQDVHHKSDADTDAEQFSNIIYTLYI